MRCDLRRLALPALMLLALGLWWPQGARAQEAGSKPPLTQAELEQVVAPIALYPDDLVSQILMASTYPLEVVQASRWANAHKNLKGDALAKALASEPWDPSVKSLVNFPDVLSHMSEKLDSTQKLGDAFISQQKDVLNAIQALRKRADAAGTLKSTEQQTVTVEPSTQTVVIQPSNPDVMYVPSYNPSTVYGAWPYPAYPPYSYYPPGYAYPGLAFATGIALGAAWGYAWGHANWGGGDININTNRNVNRNRDINRQAAGQRYGGGRGQGTWQHNPAHRGGVGYRDQATAQRFNKAGNQRAVQARESFRGRAEAGRANLGAGGAGRAGAGGAGRPGAGRAGAGGAGRPGTGRAPSAGTRPSGAGRTPSAGGAFSGVDRGNAARQYSNRGQASRSSMQSRAGGGGRSFGGGGRSFGGGGGGGRGGRGGGGRRR